MATSRELIIKLNDLYAKINKFNTTSIMDLITSPQVIIEKYNKYVTAGFMYKEKLAELKPLSYSRMDDISKFNKSVNSLKKDKTCIYKNTISQDAGGLGSMLRALFISDDEEGATVLEKIDVLDKRQKILLSDALKPINTQMLTEYKNYVKAIKEYKDALLGSDNGNDDVKKNAMKYITEYIKTIEELSNINCTLKDAEYPLLALDTDIKKSMETINKKKPTTPISPKISRYVEEVNKLKKELTAKQKQNAELRAKIAKSGIDSMNKSSISSALKVGKIKDLLKVKMPEREVMRERRRDDYQRNEGMHKYMYDEQDDHLEKSSGFIPRLRYDSDRELDTEAKVNMRIIEDAATKLAYNSYNDVTSKIDNLNTDTYKALLNPIDSAYSIPYGKLLAKNWETLNNSEKKLILAMLLRKQDISELRSKLGITTNIGIPASGTTVTTTTDSKKDTISKDDKAKWSGMKKLDKGLQYEAAQKFANESSGKWKIKPGVTRENIEIANPGVAGGQFLKIFERA